MTKNKFLGLVGTAVKNYNDINGNTKGIPNIIHLQESLKSNVKLDKKELMELLKHSGLSSISKRTLQAAATELFKKQKKKKISKVRKVA